MKADVMNNVQVFLKTRFFLIFFLTGITLTFITEHYAIKYITLSAVYM